MRSRRVKNGAGEKNFLCFPNKINYYSYINNEVVRFLIGGGGGGGVGGGGGDDDDRTLEKHKDHGHGHGHH